LAYAVPALPLSVQVIIAASLGIFASVNVNTPLIRLLSASRLSAWLGIVLDIMGVKLVTRV